MSLDLRADASLIGINSSMEMEEVYWYFWKKFQQLSVPRSVAEARVTTEEVASLEQWFAGQYGKPRNWCDRTWQERVEGDHAAPGREMFGALFLILASELARDKGFSLPRSEESAIRLFRRLKRQRFNVTSSHLYLPFQTINRSFF